MIIIRLNDIKNNSYSNNAGNFFGTNVSSWNTYTKTNTVVSGNNVSNSINILIDDDGCDFKVTNAEGKPVVDHKFVQSYDKDHLENTVIDIHDEHYNNGGSTQQSSSSTPQSTNQSQSHPSGLFNDVFHYTDTTSHSEDLFSNNKNINKDH